MTQLEIRAMERKMKFENQKCTRCGICGNMTYVKPFLCEDCAVEIYEGD